jgi:hypothetical protein
LSIIEFKGSHRARSIGEECLIKRESEQSPARYKVRLLSEKCRRCECKECKEGRRWVM